MATELTYVKITGSGLPGVFPSDYVDYHFDFDFRVHKAPDDKESELITDKKYLYWDDPQNVIERPIQRQIYRKYILKMYLQPENTYSYLKNCENIAITLNNETVHHAVVMNVDVELIADLYLKRVEVTYYDKNPANYPESPVVNYLTDTQIKQQISELGTAVTAFDTIDLGGDELVLYHTKLISHEITQSPARQTEVIAGETTDAVRYQKSGYEIDLFFSAAEAVAFIDDLTSFKHTLVYYGKAGRASGIGGYESTAIEVIDYQVEDLGGADITRVRLQYNNNKVTAKPYS